MYLVISYVAHHMDDKNTDQELVYAHAHTQHTQSSLSNTHAVPAFAFTT